MHLLLTDRLTCPRCGPEFGLILRADSVEDRRVREGGLGCPNCREVYPILGGIGDLRPPARSEAAPFHPPEPDPDRAEVALALLGVAEGPGQLAAVGEAVRYAPFLAERIPGVEVVAAGPGRPEGARADGVSGLVVGLRLPFYDRGLRGVLLEGEGAAPYLREAARVLSPRHRVVVLEAPAGARDALLAAGLTVHLDQNGVVVAAR